jgi:hypothetical protein
VSSTATILQKKFAKFRNHETALALQFARIGWVTEDGDLGINLRICHLDRNWQ